LFRESKHDNCDLRVSKHLKSVHGSHQLFESPVISFETNRPRKVRQSECWDAKGLAEWNFQMVNAARSTKVVQPGNKTVVGKGCDLETKVI
jgi:hypothetical protein